jgi:hypothetical protein
LSKNTDLNRKFSYSKKTASSHLNVFFARCFWHLHSSGVYHVYYILLTLKPYGHLLKEWCLFFQNVYCNFGCCHIALVVYFYFLKKWDVNSRTPFNSEMLNKYLHKKLRGDILRTLGLFFTSPHKNFKKIFEW